METGGVHMDVITHTHPYTQSSHLDELLLFHILFLFVGELLRSILVSTDVRCGQIRLSATRSAMVIGSICRAH